MSGHTERQSAILVARGRHSGSAWLPSSLTFEYQQALSTSRSPAATSSRPPSTTLINAPASVLGVRARPGRVAVSGHSHPAGGLCGWRSCEVARLWTPRIPPTPGTLPQDTGPRSRARPWGRRGEMDMIGAVVPDDAIPFSNGTTTVPEPGRTPSRRRRPLGERVRRRARHSSVSGCLAQRSGRWRHPLHPVHPPGFRSAPADRPRVPSLAPPARSDRARGGRAAGLFTPPSVCPGPGTGSSRGRPP